MAQEQATSRECKAQYNVAPKKSTKLKVQVKSKHCQITRYYEYDGIKIPVTNTNVKLYEEVICMKDGIAEFRTPLLRPESELEYVPEKTEKQIDDELLGLYNDFDTALDLCAKEFRKQINQITKEFNDKEKGKKIDPKVLEARDNLRKNLKDKIDELKRRQEIYNNRSWIGKVWANTKATGRGLKRGVTEYIPDFGELGKLMDEIGISTVEMFEAIFTGDIKKVQAKLEEYKKAGKEYSKEMAEQMELMLLLISDPKTRKMLVEFPARVLKHIPTDELVEHGVAMGTQWGIDAGVVVGTASACGPAGTVCGGIALAATSARKAGKLLEPVAKILNKLAKKIREKKNKGKTKDQNSTIKLHKPIEPFIDLLEGKNAIIFVGKHNEAAVAKIGIRGKAKKSFNGKGKIKIEGAAKLYSDAGFKNEVKVIDKKDLLAKNKLYYIKSTRSDLDKSGSIKLSLDVEGTYDEQKKNKRK